MHKLNTLEINKVNRSHYGRGTDFKQDFVEYTGNICFIPTSDNCFIKCNKYLTGKDYTEEFLTFLRTEKYQSGVMASARIQPFCKKYNINIGCFDGTRINPRTIRRGIIALKIQNKRSPLIWTTNDNSFNQALKELKLNFEVVDSVISDKHVIFLMKYEYEPKKVQSPSTNINVYDLETLNKTRAVPYANGIFKLSKISGKYNRDKSEKENQNCLIDCIVFKGTDFIKKMLDHNLSFKGESKKVNNKVFQ